MAKISGSVKYRVLNGISFPRPGRPRTGPGCCTDEVRLEPGPDPVELPADVAGAYLVSDPNRPPDIEVWTDGPVDPAPAPPADAPQAS